MKPRRFRNVDGNIFDLQSTLDVLETNLTGKRKAILIECPMCHRPTVAIYPNKLGSQSCKCSYCLQRFQLLMFASGKYRIKTNVGVLEVDGNKRTWLQSKYKMS